MKGPWDTGVINQHLEGGLQNFPDYRAWGAADWALYYKLLYRKNKEILCHTLSKRAALLQKFLFNYLHILFLVNLICFSPLSKCHKFYSHIGTGVNIWRGERLYLSLIDFIFNNGVNKVCPLNQSKAIPLWTLNASNEPCCFHYRQYSHYFKLLEKYFNISRASLIYK